MMVPHSILTLHTLRSIICAASSYVQFIKSQCIVGDTVRIKSSSLDKKPLFISVMIKGTYEEIPRKDLTSKTSNHVSETLKTSLYTHLR